MRIIQLWALFLACPLLASAAVVPSDSLKSSDSSSISNKTHFKVPYKQLIAPAVLMSYGIIALENHSLLNANQELNEELHENNPKRMTIDNFSQYLPTASVHLLPLLGVKAKHDFKFRATSSLIANIMMISSVRIIKATGNVWRPDRSNNKSFPSGHTANAFVGAEQIWQEYAGESIWYPLSAYGIAAGTGFLRMHNNKHWFSDVAMGAGIGILSAKIAYWITPLFVKPESNSGHKSHTQILALPSYDGTHLNMTAVLHI